MITSFFKPREVSPPAAPPAAGVATSGQTQQQGLDSEVLLLDGPGGLDLLSLSPMSIGGDPDINGDDVDADDEQPAVEDRHPPCAGFKPDITFPSVYGYPFGLHDASGKPFAWKVEVGAGAVRLRAVSEDCRSACTGKSSAGGPCKPCKDLEYCPKLTG